LIKKINIDENVNKKSESELIKKINMNKKVSKRFDSEIIKKIVENNKEIILKLVSKFKLFISEYVKEQSSCKLT